VCQTDGTIKNPINEETDLNIYFSCSITGGRQDQQVYKAITDFLLSSGHQVPTAHLSDADIMDAEQAIVPEQVFQRDCRWVSECDALVAEASTPSHGVGYEIALALTLNKPVFCFYRKGIRVSKMLTGNTSPGYQQLAYSSNEEIFKALADFLDVI
jgi:2'-deoxynucleoside 5'-phosphate N-hydrolase